MDIRRRTIGVLVIGALLFGASLLLPSPGSAGTVPTRMVLTKVASDPRGDWGSNLGDPTIAPLGHTLGQDLVAARMGRAGKNLIFVIEVTDLPSTGGVPEVTRYLSVLDVDGRLVEIDGKWSNYTRGSCDPTAGTCPPPRDPGMQPFSVRECTVNGDVVRCEESGIVKATFDADAGRIIVAVPLSMIDAAPGTTIATGKNPSTGYTGFNAMTAVFYSQDPVSDTMVPRKIYRVPRR